jgi:hypothetical protein
MKFFWQKPKYINGGSLLELLHPRLAHVALNYSSNNFGVTMSDGLLGISTFRPLDTEKLIELFDADDHKGIDQHVKDAIDAIR